MGRSIQVHQIDAFTRTPFTGNPAGVVLNADGLDEAQMLAIARELNNADTAFIFSADGADHDLRARFFTPRTEAGFVGHATVAAHYVLSRRRGASERLRQKTKSGIFDIEVRGSGDERRIAVRQANPPIGRILNDRERLAVLDALALATDDLDDRCPLRIVGTGSSRLMVGVRGTEQLKQLKPDPGRLNTLSAQLGAAGYFVFTLGTRAEGCLTEARMFCPALGIAEDPVSGNAHGLLGVYLTRLGLLKAGDAGERISFCGLQGHYLQRPGRVTVELEMHDGTIAAVWIVGQAISIFETVISL
jgi:PhzF family phenazine biosynthesis protein